MDPSSGLSVRSCSRTPSPILWSRGTSSCDFIDVYEYDEHPRVYVQTISHSRTVVLHTSADFLKHNLPLFYENSIEVPPLALVTRMHSPHSFNPKPSFSLCLCGYCLNPSPNVQVRKRVRLLDSIPLSYRHDGDDVAKILDRLRTRFAVY